LTFARERNTEIDKGGDIMPDYEQIAEGVRLPGQEPEVVVHIPPQNMTPEQAREWYDLRHPRFQGLAEQKGYKQENARLKVVHYSHEAMIDAIVANPTLTQKDLGVMFGKTWRWISRIVNSDAFQAALAKRREELTDPYIIASMEERFKGVVTQSLEIIAEKLENSQNTDLALKTLDVSIKALGFGARAAGPGQTNQFIIQLPQKAANSSEWADEHRMKQIPSQK
jgi:hypothetical protein